MRDVGVWTYGEIIQRIGRARFDEACSTGQLRRIAHGWYGNQPDSAITAALRIGGRLGCASAARLHGLWTPPPHHLHVCTRRSAPSRAAPTTVAHRIRAWPDAQPVMTLSTAIEQVVRFHDLESAVIVVESAINSAVISLQEGQKLIVKRHGPAAERFVTATAQSGTETRVRMWLQRRRIRVTPQVHVDGVGYVDLLVGRSQVIELDSRAYHTASEKYENDRARDLVLAEHGLRCLRLTYDQVFNQWARTQVSLLRILRTGEHRRHPRPAI